MHGLQQAEEVPRDRLFWPHICYGIYYQRGEGRSLGFEEAKLSFDFNLVQLSGLEPPTS
jgi:hypothetical protein